MLNFYLCKISFIFRCSGVVKHYKLYYDGQHFVGEKKFDNLEDLVSDGLVTLYLESRARKFLLQLPTADYKQSPYFTLNRSALKSLNNSKKVNSELKFLVSSYKIFLYSF